MNFYFSTLQECCEIVLWVNTDLPFLHDPPSALLRPREVATISNDDGLKELATFNMNLSSNFGVLKGTRIIPRSQRVLKNYRHASKAAQVQEKDENSNPSGDKAVKPRAGHYAVLTYPELLKEELEDLNQMVQPIEKFFNEGCMYQTYMYESFINCYLSIDCYNNHLIKFKVNNKPTYFSDKVKINNHKLSADVKELGHNNILDSFQCKDLKI
ncbi:hypothetical protein KUTeg_021013 [Tegillarca granosa]|uniref:Nucleotide-diphospho-sugar transferase domain-containing protein n=1 Tax=Tegillarca granosa TaxID=220873 RepID=A0ABQ9EC84_TEGGR|nr:hypothetical protein KUTeg_021013 [Tegillarca granosa]